MPARKGKTVVSISSSSEEEEEEEEINGGDVDADYEEEEEEVADDDEGNGQSDDDGEVDDEDVISVSSSEDIIDEEADCESVDDDLEAMPDNKHSCNRVIQLLYGGHDLDLLKLEECKAYLRNHGLRVSGTKSVCIERIQEHWRLKDGNGEKLYPRSSFVKNCTGDVCKGDVVLFTQRVYKKFDVVSRGGDPIGKRTIAGRVVKESYGAAKQQHTFTVEILWSKGVKKLPPLFPLLVKGRNLYRLKTFRQCWDDEAERVKVLAEKHKRGAAARKIRAMKKAKSANRGTKHVKHSCHTTSPSNLRKNQVNHKAQNHDTSKSDGLSSREAKANRISKARANKSVSSKRKKNPGSTVAPSKRQRKCESNPAAKTTKGNIRSEASPLMAGGPEVKTTVARSRASGSVHDYLQHNNLQRNEFPAFQPAAQNVNPPYHQHSQVQLHQGSIPPSFISTGGMHLLPSYEIGSTSTAAQLFARQPTAMPTVHHPSLHSIQHVSNNRANSGHWVDPRVSSNLRTTVDIDRQFHTRPEAVHVPKSDSLTCHMPGCKDMGAKNCVGSLCRNCCRRRGWKCPKHKLY